MAYYYTLHLTYPKCASTVLSVLQTEVLDNEIHEGDATHAYRKYIAEWKDYQSQWGQREVVWGAEFAGLCCLRCCVWGGCFGVLRWLAVGLCFELLKALYILHGLYMFLLMAPYCSGLLHCRFLLHFTFCGKTGTIVVNVCFCSSRSTFMGLYLFLQSLLGWCSIRSTAGRCHFLLDSLHWDPLHPLKSIPPPTPHQVLQWINSGKVLLVSSFKTFHCAIWSNCFLL